MSDLTDLQQVESLLKSARFLAKRANAPQLLVRLRGTLKSAGGAIRHVEHRIRRSQAATPTTNPA